MKNQFTKHSNFSQLPQQLISYQQYDNLRLERLKQQRKRMQTMYQVIIEQTNKISCYEQDIKNQEQKIYKISYEVDNLKSMDLINHNQKNHLKQLLMKQQIVIRGFKNILSDNSQISLLQKQRILQFSGYKEWESMCIQSPNNYKFVQLQHNSLLMNDFYVQKQNNRLQVKMIEAKYEQLCKHYHQLTKHNKTVQFELTKLRKQLIQKQQKQTTEFNLSKRYYQCSEQKKTLQTTKYNKKHKHCHVLHLKIAKFQAQIGCLSQQIKKKNILLDKHHQTEDQHHKLIAILKKKLKQKSDMKLFVQQQKQNNVLKKISKNYHQNTHFIKNEIKAENL